MSFVPFSAIGYGKSSDVVSSSRARRSFLLTQVSCAVAGPTPHPPQQRRTLPYVALIPPLSRRNSVPSPSTLQRSPMMNRDTEASRVHSRSRGTQRSRTRLPPPYHLAWDCGTHSLTAHLASCAVRITQGQSRAVLSREHTRLIRPKCVFEYDFRATCPFRPVRLLGR